MTSTRRQPMVETQSDFDLHQLLVPKPTNNAQSRVPSSASSGPSSDAGSFVIPENLSRSNSVYSFSRASFSSQLAGLTSMTLPQAESLAANITALPTARKAIKALNTSADQIQLWTKKALKLLENLDADDDVEWAAAAGREGLDDTEKTISKFENLITVYVLSIEGLQARNDIGDVRAEELQRIVEQMEATLQGWELVRKNLKQIHEQVELAMEWEELWNKVLGDVGVEMDSLSQLVFDMEERRHTAYQTQSNSAGNQAINISELESYIDEPANKRTTPNARFSLPPAFEGSPLGSPIISNPQDDSNLLALFARMQPLRASLDFLPMRLSMFQNRAQNIFPMACQEIEEKRERLERNWIELSKEAENLRRELSEDRWVILFRNAGRQAQKMCESVERSVAKVQEAINEGYQRTNPAALGKRIESYEAKKMHYGPAIQRVLAIIQKGLKDRLTVNGEILRLNNDVSTRMRDLTDSMEELDALLQPVATEQNSRLRESISSIVSQDRSFSSTTYAEVDTPGSSPASSVDLPPQRTEKPSSRYGMNGYSKPRAPSNTRPPLTANNKRTIVPTARRPITPLSSRSGSNGPPRGVSPSPGPTSVYRQGAYAPSTIPVARPGPSPIPSKPRWTSTVKPDDATLAPTYRTSGSVTPTGYRQFTPRSISSTTALPLRSPLSQDAIMRPLPRPTMSLGEGSYFKSFAERVSEPAEPQLPSLIDPPPFHRTRNITSPAIGTIRSPSSMAMHDNYNKQNTNTNTNTITNTNQTIRPPSSLSQNHGSKPAIPMRSSSNHPSLGHQKSSTTMRQAIEHEKSSERDPEEADESSDQFTEPGSSPLTRKTLAHSRPSLPMGGRGVPVRRSSMLPVPVAGRQSSLGHRNA